MGLKGKQYVFENPDVFVTLGAIARKMKIYAAAAELAAEIPKRQEFIGAKENVCCLCPVRHRLDNVQLIDEPSARRHSREMLGFVDKNHRRTAIAQKLHSRVFQLRTG